MSIGDHGPAIVSDRPVTFEATQEVGSVELAEQRADRVSWPWPGRETARYELAELAHMSALEAWLRRWRPINSSEVSGPQQIAERLLLALPLKAARGVRCGERALKCR